MVAFLHDFSDTTTEAITGQFPGFLEWFRQKEADIEVKTDGQEVIKLVWFQSHFVSQIETSTRGQQVRPICTILPNCRKNTVHKLSKDEPGMTVLPPVCVTFEDGPADADLLIGDEIHILGEI